MSGIQSHAQIAQVAKSLLRDYSLMIIPFYDSDSPFGQAVGSTPSATSVYNARLCGERQIASSNDKLPRTTPYSNLMALHAKLDRIDKRGFTANFFVLVPSDRANLGRLFHAGDPVFSNHIDLIPGKTTICINNDRGYRGEAGPQLLFLAAPSGLQKMTPLNRENHLRQIEKKVLEGCVTAAFPKELIESINHPCEAFIGRVIGENGGGTRVVGVRIHANDPRMVVQLRERFAQQNVREELEVSMQNQYKAFYDPSSIVAETSIFANKDRDERFRLVKNLQDLVYQTDDPNLSSAIAISGSKFVHISSNMVMIRSRGCNNLPIEEMLAVVRETARLRNITIVEPDEMHILHSKKTPPEVDPVGDPMQYGAQIITSGTKKTTGTLLVCMTKVDTAHLSEQFRRHPSIAVEPLALSKSSNAKEIIPKQMQNQYDEYITKELITKQAAEHARYAKPAVSSAKKNQGRQALIDHATKASRLQKRADKSKPNKKKKTVIP